MKSIAKIAAEGWPVFVCDGCVRKIHSADRYAAKLVKLVITKNRCAICGTVASGSCRKIEKKPVGWRNYLQESEVINL